MWPENQAAVAVFIAMTTQWRNSGFGATGLDYGVLDFIMDRKRIPAEDRDDVFESVQVMEEAALHTMMVVAERQREQDKRKRGSRNG